MEMVRGRGVGGGERGGGGCLEERVVSDSISESLYCRRRHDIRSVSGQGSVLFFHTCFRLVDQLIAPVAASSRPRTTRSAHLHCTGTIAAAVLAFIP